MFDDRRHTAGIKVAQSFPPAIGTDEAGIRNNILLGPSDLKVEVSLNLKGLTEVRIYRREGVIKKRIADHDHLCVGRNWLWPQTLRRQPTEECRGLLNVQFAVLNHSFQRLPHTGVGQNIPVIED